MTSITTTLRFREGSSDKQYAVTIQPLGDGYVVNAAWGRTGSTMQTACKTAAPVSLEQAQATAEKLLNEKRKKGYTDAEGGAAYSGVEHAGRDSGVRVQLLEPVADGQAERLLSDPAWLMQVKYDGERRLIIMEPGVPVSGTNRNGLSVAINADLATVCVGRIPITGKTIIDGEDFGSTFAPFDLLMWQGDDLRDLPYSERLALLEKLIESVPEFTRLRTYSTADDKRRMYAQLREQGEEGVVFKLRDAAYSPGRSGQSSTQFKDKFVATATCRVVGRNGDKRSVALELIDSEDGQWKPVGSCTIPANFSIPEPLQLVEIRYLYAFRAGSIFQPTYLGVRTDVDATDCTTAQLKYKAEPQAQAA